MSSRGSFIGLLPEEEWTRLDPTLGRFRSGTVGLLPLLTHRETIALLFGDNPDTGSELRSLETLEVFLDQAGLVLENAFLDRKIKADLVFLRRALVAEQKRAVEMLDVNATIHRLESVGMLHQTVRGLLRICKGSVGGELHAAAPCLPCPHLV